MRPYLLKLLKNGLPTAAILAAIGFLFAQLAGMWYVSESGGRTSTIGADEIADTLQWRLPLTMAAWGFGLVALFEGVLALWRTAPAPAIRPAVPAVDETELLLLQLLEEAEAAEVMRQSRGSLKQTPMPGGAETFAPASSLRARG